MFWNGVGDDKPELSWLLMQSEGPIFGSSVNE